MSHVDLAKVLLLLKQFVTERKSQLDLTLLGGLALQHYGMQNRATIDVDAEVTTRTGRTSDLLELFQFLKAHQIPSDLSENISGWSVVAMPPGYKDRTVTIYQDLQLRVAVLSPLDFVISKLRRFTEEDIEDALFVARKYAVEPKEIEQAAEEAIAHSVRDTTLFLFRGNLRFFIDKVMVSPENHF